MSEGVKVQRKGACYCINRLTKKKKTPRPPRKAPPAGIIRQTDPVSRTGRSGKTGATGIIRATHKNGMAGMDGKATKPLPAAKATKSAGNRGTRAAEKKPPNSSNQKDRVSGPRGRNPVKNYERIAGEG